jgi:hypothetical protein
LFGGAALIGLDFADRDNGAADQIGLIELGEVERLATLPEPVPQ